MPELQPCLEAVGDTVRGGYIRQRVGAKRVMAHRLAYQQHFGEIPTGLYVLHKCDNPRCINPDHLFLGTHLDNMRDKVNKGRQAFLRGEKNGHAKLTEEQVLQIRQDERKQKDIAIEFGISQQQVSAIQRKRFWKCLS